MTDFSVGDEVRFVHTGNDVVEGHTGVIAELADFGAHCLTFATQTGRYRALWEEMERTGRADGAVVEALERSYDGHLNEPKSSVLVSQGGDAATGEVCAECGGNMVRRGGPCLRCENCGASGGCG